MGFSHSPSAQDQPPARDPPGHVVASAGDDDQDDSSTYPCAVRHRRWRDSGKFAPVKPDDPMPTLFDLN